MLETTICEIVSDGKILLKLATRGVSKGKWNGPGGKIDPGETPEQCAVRETLEETGLSIRPIRMGTLHFYRGTKADLYIKSHLFLANEYKGKLRETDEGILRWFPLSEIPYKEMWEDDELWFPLLLTGVRFDGDFIFDSKMERLLDYEITPAK